MHWTVSRRIGLGYALTLILILVVAVVGVLALRNSSRAYRAALEQQRETLERVMAAELEARGAAIQHLRYLADPDEDYVAARDSLLALSTSKFRRLQDSAEDPELRAIWSESLESLANWEELSDEAIAAMRSGLQGRALRLHSSYVVPARDAYQRTVARGLEAVRAVTDSTVGAARAAEVRMGWLLVFGAVLAVGAAIANSLVLDRTISGPLEATATSLASSASEILEATAHQSWTANRVSAAARQSSSALQELSRIGDRHRQHATKIGALAGHRPGSGPDGGEAADDELSAELGVLEADVESQAERLQELQESIREVELAARANLKATEYLDLIARKLNRQGLSLLRLVRRPATRNGSESKSASNVQKKGRPRADAELSAGGGGPQPSPSTNG